MVQQEACLGAEARKALNVSLDPALVSEARELGVNLSRAAETGLKDAVRKAKEEAWLRENAEAIRWINEWVEENELPLREYRDF
jgi:antitoxin CcdA